MLKKLFAIILSFFSLFCLSVFCLSACGGKTPYDARVSEKLDLLYTGDVECYGVSAAAGLREEPYSSDGAVGNVLPFFRVKVVPKGNWSEGEDFSLALTVGEDTYTQKLTLSPLGDYLFATFSAVGTAEKEVTAVIYRNGESQRVPLTKTQTVDFSSALQTATKALHLQLSPHVVRGKFNGEVHARLTKVGESVYWFFSFIPQTGDPLSALIDAKEGTLLAVKDAGTVLSPSAGAQ